MCVRPIRIKNPAYRVSLNGGQPLYITVPCNKCYQCRYIQQQQWYFRCYHEVMDCLRLGGYVYFDTLTYRNSDIPKLSHFVNLDGDRARIKDFTCFNFEHYQKFLKNLRRQIEYHYGKDIYFRYFVTTEYGSDPRYTHRPHYHILLFVKSDKLTPYELSKLVSKCWPYGRTDGLPYKPYSYVLNHTYGYKCSNQDFPAIAGVCNYVSKYVTKDSAFEKVLNKRLYLLQFYLKEEEYKMVVKNISMFHRQSKGFGLGFLDALDDGQYRKMYDEGIVTMSDTKQVVCTIKAPLYYLRKLFYRLEDESYYINSEKIKEHKSWKLTELGLDWKLQSIMRKLDDMTTYYNDILYNMPLDKSASIRKLLGTRETFDFVIYKMLYQYRVVPTIDYDTLDEYIKLTINPIVDDNYLYHYPRTNVEDYVDDLLTVHNFDYITVNHPTLKLDTYNFDPKQPSNYTFEKFAREFMITQDYCDEFKHYDDIDNLFESYIKHKNENKQISYEAFEDMKKRFKYIYNYGS